MTDTIAVRDLQVGMFIHLDLGWMAHPFPLSSFRVGSPEQIATIRALGLSQVRWSPEKSDPLPTAPAGLIGLPPPPAPAGDGDAGSAPSPLARQRAGAQRCAREFQQAGRAMRALHRCVAADPAQARADAEALSRTLAASVSAEGEMSIRLLDAPFGDEAAAHAVNVAVISLLLGRVCGLDEAELSDLGVGALLHDVGHLELPPRLRRPDESFSPAEVQAYRAHVAHGVAQGKRMGLSPGALRVIAQHHEHADGTGFPLRLSAERMSMPARVVALVDRFDLLCSPGNGARGLTPHEALSLMFAQCRTQYDTTLLNAFIRMVGVYPAGSVVQLTDDRYALVACVNSMRPLKPRVLVHAPEVPRSEALLVNLGALPDLGIRRAIAPQALPPDAAAYLAPPSRTAWFVEPTEAAAPAHCEPICA